MSDRDTCPYIDENGRRCDRGRGHPGEHHVETPTMSDGPERWVPEAIAQQEEHIKREQSCEGVRFRSHSWERFSAAPGASYEACRRCQVTRTDADYQTKIKEQS